MLKGVFIFYDYYKKNEQIRVQKTIDYLKANSGPFLDVGCCDKKISNAVGALTVDVNKGLRPDILASVMWLPYKDCSFLTVSAFEVIEHVENDELALQELKRVSLNKVILSVPNSERYNVPFFRVRKRAFCDPSHKREYTLEQILQLLAKFELNVNFIRGIGYCIPRLSIFCIRFGVRIFPRLVPRFATILYVDSSKDKFR